MLEVPMNNSANVEKRTMCRIVVKAERNYNEHSVMGVITIVKYYFAWLNKRAALFTEFQFSLESVTHEKSETIRKFPDERQNRKSDKFATKN